MAYTGKWEPIGKALERIVATGELSQEEAKHALCREISDRNIHILQHLREEAGLPAKTHKGLLNGSRVFPADIDWQRSRPARTCPAFANSPLIVDANSFLAVVYDVQNLISRKVDLLELFIEDVITVFGTSKIAAESNTKITAHFKPSKDRINKKRSAPKSEGVKRAFDALFPNGMPEGKTPKDTVSEILKWLKINNLSVPDPRTVQRFLEKRRKNAGA